MKRKAEKEEEEKEEKDTKKEESVQKQEGKAEEERTEEYEGVDNYCSYFLSAAVLILCSLQLCGAVGYFLRFGELEFKKSLLFIYCYYF